TAEQSRERTSRERSSKVLPCQHTFCVSCLRRWQEKVHSQLLCPVCRLPVLVRSVEDLPENLLLARLLEGLQSLSGPDTFTQREMCISNCNFFLQFRHILDLRINSVTLFSNKVG
uniref:RING-type domain-containing protein n=1 Tax=Nothobranchius furzeri TaxID=105023 RepID=A0A8C6NJU2_NOTFU